MARQEEDMYGLMGGMSPAGFIPPAAASLASGLAGIGAQQAALRQQMAQEEEARQRTLIGQQQTVGQNLMTIGEKFKNPAMAAKGARSILGAGAPSEAEFTKKFDEDRQSERFALVSPLLSKVKGASRQALMNYALGGGATPTPGATAQPDQAVPVSGLQTMPAPEVKDTVAAAPAAAGLAPAATPGNLPAPPTEAPPPASPLMFNGIPLTFADEGYEQQPENIAKSARDSLTFLTDAVQNGSIAAGPAADAVVSAVRTARQTVEEQLRAGDIDGALRTMGKITEETNKLKLSIRRQAAPNASVVQAMEGGFDVVKTTTVDRNGNVKVTLVRKGAVPQTPQQRRAEGRAERQVAISEGNLAIALERVKLDKIAKAITYLGQRFPTLSIPDATITSELQKEIAAKDSAIAAGLKGDTTQQAEAAGLLAERVKDPTLRKDMESRLIRTRIQRLPPAQKQSLTKWLLENGYRDQVLQGTREQAGALGITGPTGGGPAVPVGGPPRPF